MSKDKGEAESITLDLSEAFRAPRPQRVERAVRLLRRTVLRRFKTSDVSIDTRLNESLWGRSRTRPPRKLKVRVRIEDDVAYVELPSE